MTELYLSNFNCPQCGKKCLHERYNVVNATTNSELTKAITEWDLFKFSCQHCDKEQIITYPTLYLDKEKKCAIHYIPYIDKATFTRQQNYIKLEGIDLSEYRCRIVHDLESFIEKVQIFNANLDDRAIELMKYTNSPLEEGDIQFSYEYIVLSQVGPSNYEFMFVNKDEVAASLDFSEEQYQFFISELETIEDKELFINEYWAGNVIRHGVRS